MIKPNVFITTEKSKLDFDFIHSFLNDSYWSKGITKDRVIKSIENSYCFGLFLNDVQIGFARVITDFTSLAYLLDVFIDKNYQGNGFGNILLKHIFEDQNLSEIKKWILATNDAQALYKKYGFSELDNSNNKYLIRESERSKL